MIVLLGVGLNALFSHYFPLLAISEKHLVHLPKFAGFSSLITLPAFGSIGDYHAWGVAFTLALLASLETLLNLEAVENIDLHKRQASPNRELLAQGIGNICTGLLGGLPITSVIVRSSVNINAGAASKLSTILHGGLLLLSVLVLSPVLNQIPLASLASILLLTGYKLTPVSLFRNMYRRGLSQFIPFVATIGAIVLTDLLIGILIGLVVSVFYLLKSNLKNPFVLQLETLPLGETMRIALPNQVSFLNKASIKDLLGRVPARSKVIIDASASDYIDEDVVEVIEDFRTTISKEKGIKLNVLGLKPHYQLEDHIEFVNVLDKETQQRLSPDDILTVLKTGNARFVSGGGSEKYLRQQVYAAARGQNPFAIVLSCIDSRTTTEHIFDLGLGDIFSVRIAGNILNEDILGSIEFGVHEAGVRLVVVLGHTGCGAIIGACNGLQLGNFPALLEKIKPAITHETTVLAQRDGTNPVFVDRVSEQNVFLTLARIRAESPLIRRLEQAGRVKLVGARYELKTGVVAFYG